MAVAAAAPPLLALLADLATLRGVWTWKMELWAFPGKFALLSRCFGVGRGIQPPPVLGPRADVISIIYSRTPGVHSKVRIPSNYCFELCFLNCCVPLDFLT